MRRPSSFLALVLLAACAHAPPRTPDEPASEPAASIALDDRPPIDEIRWITSSEEAQARSGEEQRPLLVFVRASWSEPSVVMDQTIWGDARVLREAPRFIALRIDLTFGSNKRVPDALTKQYGVETVPTTLVVNTDGSVVARFGIGTARAAEVAKAMHDAH